MVVLFCVLVVVLLLVAGLVAVLLRQGAKSGGGNDGPAVPEALEIGIPARGMNRAQPGGGMRRRQRRAAAAAAVAAEDESGGSDDDDGEDDQQPAQVPRHAKRDAYDARRAARDAEREAQEEAQEEEIRRAAEARRKREEAEAARWMHMFSVDAAGEEALSQEQGQALQARFVAYIQARKTVALDELAAEFGLRTQEVIQRVQALERDGDLTGVMDDRGKFIYISREEMAAVADFIRQRGRVAIAELAAKSDAFIDLEGRQVLLDAAAAAELELAAGA